VKDADPTTTAVSSYFAAKDSLRKEARRRHTSGLPDPFYIASTKDLENRLRAIVGQDSIDGVPLKYNASLYEGEDGDGLDGFSGLVGNAEVIITTPALAALWVRQHGDSTSSVPDALATENMLTWAFAVDLHVYPFANIKSKSALPPEVFLAQMIGRGQDDPPYANEVLVGVNRGGRIYLIIAPSVSPNITMSSECGQPYRDTYRPCFDRHMAGNPDLPKIVAQVNDLVKLVPP